MNALRYVLVVLVVGVAFHANAQMVITGMVVDSVSLEPLPGTTIRLKNANTGVTSGEAGFFTIVSRSYDTLVFSRIGYKQVQYPILGSEKDILILLREETRTLKEVVVNVYSEEKPEHSAPREVKKLSMIEGIQSPFTYFSKDEKEKRMLVRFQTEQQKVQTYVDLITRPQFRHEVMEAFSISEDEYYNILIHFNTENQSAHYLTDELEIKKAVHDFFSKALAN
jgi:hypothetical protein